MKKDNILTRGDQKCDSIAIVPKYLQLTRMEAKETDLVTELEKATLSLYSL